MRELQLEIGSKNGILKAMKLELLVSFTHLQADELKMSNSERPTLTFDCYIMSFFL